MGVFKHIGIGREHHIDMKVLAIDAYGFRRGRQIICSGLTLFFGTVFWIGFDVIAQKIKQGNGKILSGGNRAPAADRVKPHRDTVFGHQVGIFAAVNRKLPDMGISFQNRLLINLLFGSQRCLSNEIDAEVKMLFA